jgi:hypothetical protein
LRLKWFIGLIGAQELGLRCRIKKTVQPINFGVLSLKNPKMFKLNRFLADCAKSLFHSSQHTAKFNAGTICDLPAKTGSDNNNKTAVISTAQPNKASLCNLIPGLLIFKIVVIKFIAPKSELIPDKCKPKIAKSTLAPL